jgi:hypothetical protein
MFARHSRRSLSHRDLHKVGSAARATPIDIRHVNTDNKAKRFIDNLHRV